jgi:hypothetical protein
MSKNKPSDYYFCAAEVGGDLYDGWEDFEPPMIPEVDGTVFYICPKDNYENSGSHWYDGCVQAEVDMPGDFGECQEGCYETSLPLEEGRQILLDAGFIEKDMT